MQDVANVEKNIGKLEEVINGWLLNWGVPGEYLPYGKMLSLAVAVVLIALVLGYIARRVFLSAFHRLAKKTATQFDDFLIQNKAITNLSRLVPYIIVNNSIDNIFEDFPEWYETFALIVDAWLVILIIRIVRSLLFACKDYLKTTPQFHDKPVESFIQLMMIFLYIAGGLIIFSVLTGKSVVAFLTAMGAASAILLLIFKDTILGFIASIQVSINDMVRIGDWISMEKYGADGDVIEINLATVKVQNWDKTITTIPTYYLISDSFKNWRGMQNAGGRRIKRALYIKISSVRHLAEEDVEELKKIHLVSEYLEKTQQEIASYNDKNNIDTDCLVNGRHLTNLGVFRRYMEEFIDQHPKLHKDLTMMIRHLPPTPKGIPIEFYAFSKETEWVAYESIMSDIFEHLIASVKYFYLETFELPSGDDARQKQRAYIDEDDDEVKDGSGDNKMDDGNMATLTDM